MRTWNLWKTWTKILRKKMIADNFIDDMDKGNYLPLRETPYREIKSEK